MSDEGFSQKPYLVWHTFDDRNILGDHSYVGADFQPAKEKEAAAGEAAVAAANQPLDTSHE